MVGKPVNQADTFISNRSHGVGLNDQAVRHRGGMDPGKDPGRCFQVPAVVQGPARNEFHEQGTAAQRIGPGVGRPGVSG